MAGLLGIWVILAGRVLVRTEPIEHPEVVIVLSGDAHGDRLRSALSHFEDSAARRLVILTQGGRGPFDDPTKIADALIRQGVGRSKVRFLGPVGSTEEEADLVVGWMSDCGWERGLVVTSPYHTRRALFVFDRVAGNLRFGIVKSSEAYDAGSWWRGREDRGEVLSEWLKWSMTLLGARSREDSHALDPPSTC